MCEFCDGILLLERKCGVTTYLEHFEPENFNFNGSDQIQYLILNSIPSTLPNKDIIYAYSIEHKICFSWVFQYEETFHSIVIIATKMTPIYYYNYLTTYSKIIQEESRSISPLARTQEIWNDLKEWHVKDEGVLHIKMPSEVMELKLRTDDQSFGGFDLFPYLSSQDPFTFWKCLITNSPVVIRCDDLERLTLATFGLMHLVSPFPYRNRILISATSEDPRLTDPVGYSIIACPGNKQFSITGKNVTYLSVDIYREVPLDSPKRRVISKANDDLQLASLITMNNFLIINPFSDILSVPMNENPNLAEYFLQAEISTPITPDEFRQFSTTPTFDTYRKLMIHRTYLRNALLSVNPKETIQNMSRENAQQIYEYLPKLEKFYQNDSHMISVLHRYRKILLTIL